MHCLTITLRGEGQCLVVSCGAAQDAVRMWEEAGFRKAHSHLLSGKGQTVSFSPRQHELTDEIIIISCINPR